MSDNIQIVILSFTVYYLSLKIKNLKRQQEKLCSELDSD